MEDGRTEEESNNDREESVDQHKLTDKVCEAIAKFAPHLSRVTEGILLVSKPESTTVSIDAEIVVKYGEGVAQIEADTLRFIAKETEVPVPEVIGFCQDDENSGYLVLTQIQGSPLYAVWDSCTLEEKDGLVRELAGYFRELHSITGTFIGTVKRGPPRDKMFEGAHPSGPYETEKDMNEAILRASRSQWEDLGGDPPESFVSTTLPWLPADHKIVFSHGDLCMSHIIVEKEDKKVTGIVGWSRAGFFPEHWDFVNAIAYKCWFSDWIKFVPFVLQPYYTEYALWYRIRRLAFGLPP